jgi:hypothetical protein
VDSAEALTESACSARVGLRGYHEHSPPRADTASWRASTTRPAYRGVGGAGEINRVFAGHAPLFALWEHGERLYNIALDGEHCYRVGEQDLLVQNATSGMTPNPVPAPAPAAIPQAEVDVVRRAWAQNSHDIGLGLYNPGTGEIHVGTFDTSGLRIGHDGLQLTLGFPDSDRPQWRGFIFNSTGQAINSSGFNEPDGAPPRMRPDSFAEVEAALRCAGLI